MPTDYLPMLWDDLDFSDLFHILGQEFEIRLDRGTFSGTLDSLIRLVDESMQSTAKQVDETSARARSPQASPQAEPIPNQRY